MIPPSEFCSENFWDRKPGSRQKSYWFFVQNGKYQSPYPPNVFCKPRICRPFVRTGAHTVASRSRICSGENSRAGRSSAYSWEFIMGDGVCQWDWRGCNITVTLGAPPGGPGYLYVMWDGRGSCTLGCNGGKKKFESRCGVFLSASIVSHAGGYVNQHFRGGLIYNVGVLPS